MTATLDQRTRAVLKTLATDDEIASLLAILDRLSRGRAEPWMAAFVVEIIKRLADRTTNAPERPPNES